MLKRKIIAIDCMGGDNAPSCVFEALSVVDFQDCHFIIFGDRNQTSKFSLPSYVSHEFRHVDLNVTSDMDVSVLRTMTKSGMGQAIQAVKSGEAQAVVSSGNTGIYFALAKVFLNTMDGINRPALATVIPGKNGPTICLDLGANAECSVKNLFDFAVLGEALAHAVLQKANVSLALLNIGSEDYKGNALVKEASKYLRQAFPNYIGFCEGDSICNGSVDVIITDGFTGNVALKSIEGAAKFIVSEFKAALKSNFISMLGAVLAKSAIGRMKIRMDPRLHNGALFAGLNGIVVKSHGNSDKIGFANAIKFAMRMIDQNMLQQIRDQLEKLKPHYDAIMGENS